MTPLEINIQSLHFALLAGRVVFLLLVLQLVKSQKSRLNLALLKGCQIVGVFWGSWAMQFPNENMLNTMELIQWHAQGKLNPHIHAVYPLEQTQKAMEEMTARKVRGKIVIECS